MKDNQQPSLTLRKIDAMIALAKKLERRITINGVEYIYVEVKSRSLQEIKEGPTTIPQGSTLQADGSGSAEPLK